MPRPRMTLRTPIVLGLWLASMAVAYADAGPPFLTTDPGTPGDGHWEINLGSAATTYPGLATLQVPQVDLNYGVGDTIQLTLELPYELAMPRAAPTRSGWGNGYAGIKWRFLDQGEDGFKVSTFPQLETGVSAHAEARALAGPGPRLLLPIEVAHKVGPLDVDVEVGYYAFGRMPRERFVGLVVGGAVTRRTELDVELFSDRVMGSGAEATTIDVGARFQFTPALIGLVMAGHGVGTHDPTPTWIGCVGVQVLLSDYGRHWALEH